MYTHQVRKRVFKLEPGTRLEFPNYVEVDFFLSPLQPFGMEKSNGRTTLQSTKASAFFNSNNGHHYITPEKGLDRLDIHIETPTQVFKVSGNHFKYCFTCQSNAELTEIIHSFSFGIPILLNIDFGDPPVVDRVAGTVGGTKFRWELADWKMNFVVTNQETQEQKVVNTWNRFNIISHPNNKRLIAALIYYHRARRLARAGSSPWEFMSEIILNYSKVLEVLFPGPSSIDSARSGLSNLGFTVTDIEKKYIPAIALRNKIDGAHVDMTIFSRAQLEIIHGYTERMEATFSDLLGKIMVKIEAGEYSMVPHTLEGPDKDDLRIIERMKEWLN